MFSESVFGCCDEGFLRLAGATTTVLSDTDATSGAVPAVLRNDPSRPNSARNARSATTDGAISSCATRSAMAMARSRDAPPFRTDAPARLTVIRRLGHGKPLDSNAARTRSRDSLHASSGRPTTVKPGIPIPMCASTVTWCPWAPSNTAELIAANMWCPFEADF